MSSKLLLMRLLLCVSFQVPLMGSKLPETPQLTNSVSVEHCDVNSCSKTSVSCTRNLTSTCRTKCDTYDGCEAECPLGNCSKMHCFNEIDNPEGYTGYADRCTFNCKGDCPDMNCTAKFCYPFCTKDNCRMSCGSKLKGSKCHPGCRGTGCEINCSSSSCEAVCEQGCKVRFGKHSSGFLNCLGGHCSLVCAKGKKCSYWGPCPFCSPIEYVDDPFSQSHKSAEDSKSGTHVKSVK